MVIVNYNNKASSYLGGARTCVILGEAGLSPAKPCRDETQVTIVK